jgi:hypothetical protein
VAGSVEVLGNTILAVRLPTAFLGTLAVAAAFLLGRKLLGPGPALIGAGLVAVTFWTVLLSRIGYRANALPVFFPLWLVSFWRCRHRRDLVPYLLAGLLLGLAQYTYTAARFLPFLALVIAWDWRKALSRRGLVAGLGVALLVALPLAWAILSAPEIGSQRIRQAALWNRPEPWPLLWLQLRSHLLMFGFSGDPLWIHNLPFRPPVALPIALLFVIGAITGWRRQAERSLCWSVLVLLWPGILAVSNNPAPPDHLRVVVVATPIMLLAGAGLVRLTRHWPQWVLALALLFVVADGAISWRDYRQWSTARQTYEQFDADMTRIARKVADNPQLFYLVPISPDWHEFEPGRHWTIDYLTGQQNNYQTIGVPYTLPALSADQVALVTWQAGMHLSADPQHTLAGQLELSGYTKQSEETENTFLLSKYVRTGAPVEVTRFAPQRTFSGGFRISAVNVYRKAEANSDSASLIAEVAWESPGAYAGPLAVSMRLLDKTGALAAQVDSALWNELGEAAQKWRTPEASRLFLEIEATSLPAGEYTIQLFPYQADTLVPLPRADSKADQAIGMVVVRP